MINSLGDSVNNLLQNYFKITYKKINYIDFFHTNDFYIHKIKFILEVVSDYDKHNDKGYLGQILQNCIIDLEKPIMMSTDNKLIKLSISE